MGFLMLTLFQERHRHRECKWPPVDTQRELEKASKVNREKRRGSQN